ERLGLGAAGTRVSGNVLWANSFPSPDRSLSRLPGLNGRALPAREAAVQAGVARRRAVTRPLRRVRTAGGVRDVSRRQVFLPVRGLSSRRSPSAAAETPCSASPSRVPRPATIAHPRPCPQAAENLPVLDETMQWGVVVQVLAYRP